MRSKMEQDVGAKVLAGVRLPVRPAQGADGAALQLLVEELPPVAAAQPLFGGYAEDFLAEMGVDSWPEASESVRAARLGKA